MESVQPVEAVVICSSPRTGSGVLCSALWSTDLCGRPDEYLGPGTRRDYEALWGSAPAQYQQRVLEFGTTPNGVFAIKVHWHDLPRAGWIGSGRSPLTTLAPRVHFYLLRRRDKVRQAVSWHRARASRRYKVRDGDPVADADVLFDYHAIRRALDDVDASDRGWDAYFEGARITPTVLTYEDDVEHTYEHTARSIIGGLAVEAPPSFSVTTEFRKQSDDVTERLVERFRQGG